MSQLFASNPLDSSSSLLIDNSVYQQMSSEEKRDSLKSDKDLNSHFNSLSKDNEITNIEWIYNNKLILVRN